MASEQLKDIGKASAQDLLAALETAGRAPSLDLVRAAMNRRHDLTEGLLDMLATPPDANWEEKDPRRYAQIHAGNLLIFYREPQAIPIFMRLLRQPDSDTFVEWFEQALASYGLGILPDFADLLNDPTAPEYARHEVTSTLKQLVAEFPTERAKVIHVLRTALPALDKKGKPVIPKPRPEKPNLLWTFVSIALAELSDLASRSQVEALYRDKWIDTAILGSFEEYMHLLQNPEPLQSDAFNIIGVYETLLEEEKKAEWDGKAMLDLHSQQRDLNAAGQPMDDHLDPLTLVSEPPEIPPTVPPTGIATPNPGSLPSFAEPAPEPVRRADPKVGRNDPCPCGSGRKYKHCHGKS